MANLLDKNFTYSEVVDMLKRAGKGIELGLELGIYTSAENAMQDWIKNKLDVSFLEKIREEGF